MSERNKLDKLHAIQLKDILIQCALTSECEKTNSQSGM